MAIPLCKEHAKGFAQLLITIRVSVDWQRKLSTLYAKLISRTKLDMSNYWRRVENRISMRLYNHTSFNLQVAFNQYWCITVTGIVSAWRLCQRSVIPSEYKDSYGNFLLVNHFDSSHDMIFIYPINQSSMNADLEGDSMGLHELIQSVSKSCQRNTNSLCCCCSFQSPIFCPSLLTCHSVPQC